MTTIQTHCKCLAGLILLMLFACMNSYAQTDASDGEINFRIIKKRICKRSPHESELQQAGLHGPVKTIITQRYENNNFKNIMTSNLTSTKTSHYDTSGVLTGYVVDLGAMTSWETNKRKFDDKGRILQEEIHNGGIRFRKKSEYIYDANGALAAIHSTGYQMTHGTFPDKKIKFDFTAKFDAFGNCTEEESLTEKTLYKYDSNGYLLETATTYKIRKDPPSAIHCVYGSNCKVETEYITGKGTVKKLYTYDSNDSLTEKREIGATGDTTLTVYKYDDKGNKLQEKKTVTSKKGTETISYAYIYDEIGNWTQREEFADNRPTGHYFRQIFYY